MTVNVSQRDMRVQRAIDADAKIREIGKKSVNWPDPKARPRNAPRHDLKPIYVFAGSPSERFQKEAEAKARTEQVAAE